ncbi:MAG: ketosteroid isomerase-related protein [Sphingobium sp.]|uniref:ketosteroid isomerase-related protein n=1 Tax=Sphingobium sp. CECT 9361 TaxID=2845384 RepID=UPI001E53BDC7|nr:ketosteroid isomerase-related protein [Sphingobium sp. CECT 9361]
MPVELVSMYYDAFNLGDSNAMLDLLTDGVLHEPSQGAGRIGKAAFAEFLDHMNRCYREEVIDPVFLTSADGTRCAAEFWLNGTYLHTDGHLPAARGQAYRLRVGAFFEIVDGRLSRVSNHYNLADWLAQIA